LHARFGYFAETFTVAATEWFDALNLALYADMDALYTDFFARFAFNPTDHLRENQIFRQSKQKHTLGFHPTYKIYRFYT